MPTREAAGFAYRMLYIDPMLARSALGDCAITPLVVDAVAEDPALAAVLAETFEAFPGAVDPFALPAVVAGLPDVLWRRCDRKIAAASPDDNTAVKRARGFLDTAIESSVTAEDLQHKTGTDASASRAALRAIRRAISKPASALADTRDC